MKEQAALLEGCYQAGIQNLGTLKTLTMLSESGDMSVSEVAIRLDEDSNHRMWNKLEQLLFLGFLKKRLQSNPKGYGKKIAYYSTTEECDKLVKLCGLSVEQWDEILELSTSIHNLEVLSIMRDLGGVDLTVDEINEEHGKRDMSSFIRYSCLKEFTSRERKGNNKMFHYSIDEKGEKLLELASSIGKGAKDFSKRST